MGDQRYEAEVIVRFASRIDCRVRERERKSSSKNGSTTGALKSILFGSGGGGGCVAVVDVSAITYVQFHRRCGRWQCRQAFGGSVHPRLLSDHAGLQLGHDANGVLATAQTVKCRDKTRYFKHSRLHQVRVRCTHRSANWPQTLFQRTFSRSTFACSRFRSPSTLVGTPMRPS